MAKIEGVKLSGDTPKTEYHPNVLKRIEHAENARIKRKKNRSIAHIKPIIRSECIEMLVKCYSRTDILKHFKENYQLSTTSIDRTIEEAKTELNKIGERKLKDAQRNAIAEMEVTKAIFARHIEHVDKESGEVILDKDASRLFIDAQKRQHTLLGLDKLAIDIRATGAESLTESELIERAKLADVERVEAIE